MKPHSHLVLGNISNYNILPGVLYIWKQMCCLQQLQAINIVVTLLVSVMIAKSL